MSGRPLFSIGAVARTVGVSVATIRTWEARYGLVRPERSQGGQRLYSRDQVEQLRFVRRQIEAGRRPGEAHRLLEEWLESGDRTEAAHMRLLLADSGLATSPMLLVIDPGDLSFDEVSARLAASGAKLVPIEP